MFISLVECGTPAVLRVLKPGGSRFHIPACRHQGKAADLKLMESWESVYGCVSILVSDGFPAACISICTIRGCSQLGHSEWH